MSTAIWVSLNLHQGHKLISQQNKITNMSFLFMTHAYLFSSTNNGCLLSGERDADVKKTTGEINGSKIMSGRVYHFYWSMCVCVCVPAGGSCEAGSVVDRRYSLIH